jgi:hypothetical protein
MNGKNKGDESVYLGAEMNRPTQNRIDNGIKKTSKS